MASLADLPPREMEIVQLVLAGKTNKTSANEVTISPKTVEFHLDNIYRKIGLRTRMLAGLWDLQNGLPIPAREILGCSARYSKSHSTLEIGIW